jgi:predicted amidophosphoribosyltransferase
MGAELFGARAEVERLRASRARWSVAAGIAADTLCPQCGVGVDTDEDGCCWTCGATATGDAVESRRVSIEAAEAADVAAGVSDV